ncbi:MAG TPA: hypothetical protein PK668_20380 [Myxococcota bacterium]|nr:hypothetical protein [Myxococcota bacterium]HRY96187.1 hypothetical protein [Myxococcota bacterium]HSA24053.1 hypothetical protein [Myxococcota bacterium]
MKGNLILWVLGLSTAGCAAWLGEVPPLKVNSDTAASNPVQRAPVPLFVERPEVLDNDEEKDFTPLAEKFSVSLQQRLAEYLCARGAFARCTTEPTEGAYRLAGKVLVGNFRPTQGGAALAIVAGLFLPPFLGMIWSFPVGFGSCDLRVELALHGPAGEVLWRGELRTEGMASCQAAEVIGYALRTAVDEVLPAMANAASGAEEVAARARAPRTAEVASPVEAPAPAGVARREVLAVFDVQDVASRFKGKEAELVQLTTFLATAMAATGKFTVVPREQLRQRLLEEKKDSYRACYDNACQIELGKAVAAEKTLATQLIQVGAECAVVANVYDLRSETAATAAMVQTACGEAQLLDAMRQVAEQIARQAR